MTLDRTCMVALLVTMPTMLFAQEPKTLGPDERAAITAQRIAVAIGLDEQATGKIAELLLQGEQEVADLRAQCEELHREIDGRLLPYFEQMAANLEADQAARLEALMASGALGGCRMEAAPATAPASSATRKGTSAPNAATAPSDGGEERKPAKGRTE